MPGKEGKAKRKNKMSCCGHVEDKSGSSRTGQQNKQRKGDGGSSND